MRCPLHLVLPICLAVLAPAAYAQDHTLARIELERPVAVSLTMRDGRTVTGRATAYDGWTLWLDGDDPASVEWVDTQPPRAYAALQRIIDTRDAQAWFAAGRLLLTLEGGEEPADDAFKRAVKLDASLEAQVAQAREEVAGQERLTREQWEERRARAATSAAAAGAARVPPGDGDGPVEAARPEVVGAVQAGNWGPQSPEQNKAAVAQLDAYADEGLKRIGVPMRRIETDYFIFYNDLDPREAARWAGLLDKMYNRLCDLFGVSRGTNIWRGKCLIFVFRREADFHKFEEQVHGKASVGEAAGRCWGYGNGDVHVTFYRQPHEMRFAHILVHEAVHGFLHRYRSPVHIPSVWNEGLAEVIAAELVPESHTVPQRQRQAIAMLRELRSVGGMFNGGQIDGWHYGLASSMTAFMIRQNKKGYVAFINAIKDGQPWELALENQYGASLQRIFRAWADANNVREVGL